MTSNTQLIVLSLTKFKDNAIVLHCLSREYGRRSFIVNVGKGGSMAMFLPLSILEADVIENPKSQLARAKNISALYPLYSLRSDMYKNSIAMFLSEVLYRSIRDVFDEELMDLVQTHLKRRKFRGFTVEDIDIQLIARPTRKSKNA